MWRGRPRPRPGPMATPSHSKEERAIGTQVRAYRETGRPSEPINLPPRNCGNRHTNALSQPPEAGRKNNQPSGKLSVSVMIVVMIMIVVIVMTVAPVPIFFLFIVVQSTEVPIFAMIFDDPLMVVHGFGTVPAMIVVIVRVVDAIGSSRTTGSYSRYEESGGQQQRTNVSVSAGHCLAPSNYIRIFGARRDCRVAWV